MWLWAQRDPHIHTLVVGAARPSDFDQHVEAARRFVAYDAGRKVGKEPDTIAAVERRLMDAYDAVWAPGWTDDWWVGLPDCYQVRKTCMRALHALLDPPVRSQPTHTPFPLFTHWT